MKYRISVKEIITTIEMVLTDDIFTTSLNKLLGDDFHRCPVHNMNRWFVLQIDYDFHIGSRYELLVKMICTKGLYFKAAVKMIFINSLTHRW